MPSYDKPQRSEFFHGDLYQRMADDLHLTVKAQRTVHGYLRAVRKLAVRSRTVPEAILCLQYFLDEKRSPFSSKWIESVGIWEGPNELDFAR